MKRSGFTLVEVLLFLAISSIVLLATSSFITYNLRSTVRVNVRNQVDQELLHISDIITTKLKEADSIISPTPSNNATSLHLMPASGGTNPIIFDVAASTISITEDGNAPVALNSSKTSVDSISFTNLSASNTPGTIQFTITMSYLSDSSNEYTYTRTITTSGSVRR